MVVDNEHEKKWSDEALENAVNEFESSFTVPKVARTERQVIISLTPKLCALQKKGAKLGELYAYFKEKLDLNLGFESFKSYFYTAKTSLGLAVEDKGSSHPKTNKTNNGGGSRRTGQAGSSRKTSSSINVTSSNVRSAVTSKPSQPVSQSVVKCEDEGDSDDFND